MQRRQLLVSLAASAAPFAPRAAAKAPANPWQPGTAPLVLVVPFSAGGASDALARQLAPLLAQALQATVRVENVPGASGTLAAQRVLSAPPDGRSILVVSSSETILPPLLMRSVKFQAQDFRLLSGSLSAPLALLGRPGLLATTLDTLLARAADPALPPLSCGHLGRGSVMHLAAEHFSQLTGVTLTQVPYRGGAPLMTDLAGDQVDLAFLALAGPLLPVVQARKLHIYGVSAAAAGTALARQHPRLDEHPGLHGFAHAAWLSFAVPQAVPETVAQQLNQHLNAALQSPALQLLAAQMGAAPYRPADLAEAARFYSSERRSLQALARAVGLQPQ
jgi:tripartite-type tricarboxylate transporter receptor subunit TctC